MSRKATGPTAQRPVSPVQPIPKGARTAGFAAPYAALAARVEAARPRPGGPAAPGCPGCSDLGRLSRSSARVLGRPIPPTRLAPAWASITCRGRRAATAVPALGVPAADRPPPRRHGHSGRAAFPEPRPAASEERGECGRGRPAAIST